MSAKNFRAKSFSAIASSRSAMARSSSRRALASSLVRRHGDLPAISAVVDATRAAVLRQDRL
jgi:hypothetical protein